MNRDKLSSLEILKGIQGAHNSPEPAPKRYSALVTSDEIQCPPLNDEVLSKLNENQPLFITRHMDAEHLEKALDGFFHFGTIEGYNPQDNKLGESRFGDFQEGRQRDHYFSETGHFKSFRSNPHVLIEEAYAPDGIAVEYTANDYCSCSIIGEFSHARARQLKSKGNPSIGAYVTYDLAKLKDAINTLMAKRPGLIGHRLVCQCVRYGNKDRNWHAADNFVRADDREDFSRWLSIALVKAPAYAHELEFRLLLLDAASPGGLPSNTAPLFLPDAIIAECIVDFGRFD
ncbi:hypothetical protein [Rhizobium bangladeshense]|uniref:hypothetical protein n=1 Tax=Rhizobium bangladeshense TaxID=1138189 RepID=UPI001C82E6EC|nr:hypothetical protein [Rhizobium bangladeshense]MBX4912784.1 hypothetical protein [Rhizobium bangladeshense]